MARVLLVGESEVLIESRQKGFDIYQAATPMSDVKPFIKVLTKAGHEVVWLDNQHAAEGFPLTIEELDPYDVVIFSDIGSNTLLIPRAVHEGYAFPNRLELLRKWVEKGGSFLMCGGWASFSGMNGTAHYHRTPVEELLPVDIHPFDDRMESPQGVTACIRIPNHPILRGVPDAWPPLLGYNWVEANRGSDVIIEAGNGDPLLAVGTYGAGKSAAWTSDIAPHWISHKFAAWEGYDKLFSNIVSWLSSTNRQ